MNYHVQALPGDLRKAADATQAAFEQVKSAKLGDAADKISRALPGSTSAPAATSTGRSWTATVDDWCRGGNDYASALRRSADEYQSGDDAAASDLWLSRGP